jgi:hypothetical protein
METIPPQPPVELSVTPAPAPLQCSYCATTLLFLGCTPSEQCAEWICPICRMRKIRPMAMPETFLDSSITADSVLPEPTRPGRNAQ